MKNERHVSFHGPLPRDREDRVSATDECRQALSSTRVSVSSLRLQPSSVFVAVSGSEGAKDSRFRQKGLFTGGMQKQLMFVT